jgi:hypothetical protein
LIDWICGRAVESFVGSANVCVIRVSYCALRALYWELRSPPDEDEGGGGVVVVEGEAGMHTWSLISGLGLGVDVPK